MEAVIEIVQDFKTGMCGLDCEFLDIACKWTDLDQWGNAIPSDKCPGPGRYRLVRVEEE